MNITIAKLAGSKTIGILCDFPYDGDSENSPTQSYFNELVNKVWQKKFPESQRPKYPGWKGDPHQLAICNKWSTDRWQYRVVLEQRQTEEGKELWEKAVKKYGTKNNIDMLVDGIMEKIKKSKYKTLIAVSSRSEQRDIEPVLKRLKFKPLLRFTNPNTGREYYLILWAKQLR